MILSMFVENEIMRVVIFATKNNILRSFSLIFENILNFQTKQI